MKHLLSIPSSAAPELFNYFGSPLRAAVLSAIPLLLASSFSTAAIVENGDVLDIDSSTQLDNYFVTGAGSTLNSRNATTRAISLSKGGILNLTGGSVQSLTDGVVVNNSTATITNTNIAGEFIGLSVNRPIGRTGGSLVQVTGATIQGFDVGAQVTGLSLLQLSGTQVTGTGAESAGLNVFGGDALVTNGSTIQGGENGVYLITDSNGVGDNRLILDNSSIEGINGAAIALDFGVDADIQISNNAVLKGGNGNILEVKGDSIANMKVSRSSLEGNIQVDSGSGVNLALNLSQIRGDIVVAEGGTGTLSLQNNSAFTGNLTDVNNVDIGASTFSGSIVSTDGTGVLTLRDGSTLNGSVTGADQITVDASSMTANVISTGPASSLSLQNGSVLTGSVTGISTLDLNASRLTGDVNVANAGSVLLSNRSILEGDVIGSNNVRLDGSSMTGNITSASTAGLIALAQGSTLEGNVAGSDHVTLDASLLKGDVVSASALGEVSLGNGSTINGNVNSNHLSLDASSLTGDITSIDAAGAVSLRRNSVVTGNVSSNAVSLDSSSLTGDITSIDGTGTVSLQDSVLAGNVSSNTVNLDTSSLNGDINSVDGRGTVSLKDSVLAGNVNSNTVSLDASSLTGNITSIDGAGAVSLQHDSIFTGNLINVDSVIIGDPSVWNMVGNNTVNSLTMNDGVVKFGASNEFYQLNVGNLSGNGTFVMDADYATNQHDLLNVTGSATGSHTLLIAGAGVDPVSPEPLTFVHTAGGDATFALAGGRPVDVGTYSYELASRANASGGSDWFLDPGTKTISPGTASVLALFNTAPTVWYGELTSLRSRMGELRFNGGKAGGWMRTYGNKYDVNESSGVGYQQTQQGFSLGADAPLPIGDGQWLVGVLGGYSKSDLNLSYGTSGTVKSYYAGLYTTWMDQASGYYFDGVLKLNRFRNDSKVSISDGTRAKGDYDNLGLGGSVEFGRHIKLDDGYFVEPFGQLSSVVIQGKDYFLNNEMRAQGDRTRSLLGKVGVTAGRNFTLSDGKVVQPYVRMAGVHEFAKNNEVQVNNNVFNNDLSGSRGELGAGVAVALSDSLQLHADFDYGSGKHIEQPFGANFGLRYNW